MSRRGGTGTSGRRHARVVSDRVLAAVIGPLATVPLFVELSAHLRSGVGSAAETAELLRLGLVLGFYVLIVWALLTRGGATATARSRIVRALAFAGTFAPVAIPPLTAPAGNVALLAAGDVLILVGLAWSVWSLAHLRRSFSVVPAARELITSGPYRFARHPLYLGELTAALGVVVAGPTAAAFAVWLLAVALQLSRARNEERLLAATFPAYEGYRRRTGRIVPRLVARRTTWAPAQLP